jgi:hypothetical protein
VDVVTRNNLFIGTSGPALWSTGAMIRCDFDSDGYAWAGSGLGMLAGGFAQWNAANYGSVDAARRSGALYRRRGAVVLPAAGNFVGGLGPPNDSRPRVPRDRVDLRLARNSPAVDVGVVVPNFSDGFTGRAPDLGCCEVDQALPHYGPRW